MLKLGFQVAEATVAKYLPEPQARPPGWRSFLKLHLAESAGMDFFAIPTVTFGVLYGFLVIRHRDRQILHLNVTSHPTAEWVKRQLIEAFPFDEAPEFLHRDNDAIYSAVVREAIATLGINDVPNAPRSPWQNPYAEREIGNIRRELLDHVIVLGESHARVLLREYQRYHNEVRPHLSLAKDAPLGREVQGPERGAKIVALPQVFGLHHKYERRAA